MTPERGESHRRRRLRQFGEAWLERKRARLARSTWKGYAGYLRGHVFPALAHRPLSSLRPADFDHLVAELETSGKPAGTVRNCLVPVKSMLTDAVRLGLLASNVAARVDLPTAPQTRGKDIPPEHLAKIRAALVALAPDDPFRPGERDTFAALTFDVALCSGLRWGELAALTWAACAFERRTIAVERSLSLGDFKSPKTREPRRVPMSETAAIALRALAARGIDRGRYAPGELVFASAAGTPLHDANWNHRVWAPALQKAGLGEWVDKDGKRRWRNRYRWHDLRHTAVSRLIAAGADVALVQAVAGHASAATTLRVYTHLRDSRIEEAARRFDPGCLEGVEAPIGH